MRPCEPIKIPTRKDRFVLRTMIVLGLLSMLNFAYWFFQPKWIDDKPLFVLLAATLLYTGLRVLYEWYHYWDISVSLPARTEQSYTIDVLTTYFPGEPYEMIEETLLAIKAISYPHTTILCDEANDPHLKEFCKQYGIVHVSRDNRHNAKAGNINNALTKVAKGEICVILDPDHVPQSDFLDAVLPYFDDPDIGFVQVVQAYKNLDESYVAKGAAQQTFQFYGPMMMCMNSYGTVNAIGANCTFRRAALDSIGGHAPGLAEDMHTAMQLHAKGWKSVYVPKVLARGLVPSSLTAYYKQQLKWSRGTLELLVATYPKLFKNFTWRQRIHYGTIPLHYLIGFFYFINFLIPILSLTTATTPWKGNVLFFAFITLPLAASVLFVRTYVQRWVMEENERGFHVVGGLLQITAWWIFCVGGLYTLLRKKVPYLPTPKTGDDKTSWKLLAPNLVIAAASLTAVVYGLSIDLTPFSIFMSGFALLNASFMLFTVYLGQHRYSNIDKIKGLLQKEIYRHKHRLKVRFWNFRHNLYRLARKVALPALTGCILLSVILVYRNNYLKWEGVTSHEPLPHLTVKSLGVFLPKNKNGVSSLNSISEFEENLKFRFDMVSHYVPWGDMRELEEFRHVLYLTTKQGYTPMITWEPWASNFSFSPKDSLLIKEKKVFRAISNGVFDTYLENIANLLANTSETVYLRFAHEFDNPSYPWSKKGENNAAEFKLAWQYLWKFFSDRGVQNVRWVWNPWKAEGAEIYYPGDSYVDYIGITGLNYSDVLRENRSYSFDDLYTPFRNLFERKGIHKPVLVAEFGSLNITGNQTAWVQQGLESVYQKYPEITSVVFFNSAFDINMPPKIQRMSSLDWSLENPDRIKETLWKLKEDFYTSEILGMDSVLHEAPIRIKNTEITKNIIGVNYKKGLNWATNYQVLTRESLVRDFSEMSKMGMTHVRYYGSTLYHYNVFKMAELYEIQLSYGIWLNTKRIDKDPEKVIREIQKTVNTLKEEDVITSWHLGNDILSHLWKNEKSTALYERQQSYMKWLNRLLKVIEETDGSRPVTVELDLNDRAIYHMQLLNRETGGFDAIGLSMKEPENYPVFESFARSKGMAFMISDLSNEGITFFANHQKPKTGFYFQNWQDRHESNQLSFDGLLDYDGIMKLDFANALHFLYPSYKVPVTPQYDILRPAQLLYPGKSYDYHAVRWNESSQRYIYPSASENTTLEWYLVKYDHFQNPLALKKVGEGPSAKITVPEEYENFRLALRYLAQGYSKMEIVTLNTPLPEFR